MPTLDPRIAAITDRIIDRSEHGRTRYLAQMVDQAEQGRTRPRLSCGNFAHGFAAARRVKTRPTFGQCAARTWGSSPLGGGSLSLLRDGDVIRLCGYDGILETNADLASRDDAPAPPPDRGTGRELFGLLRVGADDAERGASAMLAAMEIVT